MGRFVEGEDHSQATLLPACFDDFIAEDNPIRIVDAFVSLVAAVRLKMWFRQERAEHCGPFDWAFQAHGRRAAGFAVRGRQRFDITGTVAVFIVARPGHLAGPDIRLCETQPVATGMVTDAASRGRVPAAEAGQLRHERARRRNSPANMGDGWSHGHNGRR